MEAKRVLFGSFAVLFSVALPDVARAERCGRDPPPRRSSQSSPAEEEERPTDDACIERGIYFMPGAVGIVYQPNVALGAFYGGGVQIAPYQWNRNNDRFGPSQGSLYFTAALLQSPRTSGTMALFEVGATASFERNASRRYLIPFFGGTLGGVTHSDLGTGTYAYPMGGVHLYWHHNIMVDAEGGYHFPFVDVDRGRGPRGQLTARFSLW